jgi:hypothetical protein
MIADINLLTEEESLDVRAVVYELKEFWIQRDSSLPFYTLGAACAYDDTNNKQSYYTKAKRYNSILGTRVNWLYKRLADTLALKLEASVSYRETLALPGFHIFLSHKDYEQPNAAIHSDLHYQLFDWESTAEEKFKNTISFTLAIALPKYGGGLNIWDLSIEEMVDLPPAEINQLIKSRKKSFYPYKVGSIALHSGHIVHQIAPGKNLQPDDERITLQGHGVLCQGNWQLYW